MIIPVFVILLPLSCVALAAPHSDHSHQVNRQLTRTWYHSEKHHVHRMFKRAASDEFFPVGSPEWSADYPRATPDSKSLPAAWVDALNAAVAAGNIPNIPQSHNTPGVNPVYPDGLDATGPEVCSATYKCRNSDDIWDAPDGVFASSFDDGPLPATTRLADFLISNNVKSTHFMIGVNILNNPGQFNKTFNAGHDIAVHTWTHPYMTTLSNLDILAQLGYTMDIIYKSTQGRVAKFWRPPYGDSDNRVRAIAKEVFGLTTVIWNQDPSDWAIPSGTTTSEQVASSMQRWLTGPKSPGLIILEHETSDVTVNTFMAAFPSIQANNWTFTSLTEIIDGGDTYQNSESSTSPVTPGQIVAESESSSTSETPPATSSSPSQSSDQNRDPKSVTTSAHEFSTSAVTSSKSSAAASRGQSHGWIPFVFLVSMTLLSL